VLPKNPPLRATTGPCGLGGFALLPCHPPAFILAQLAFAGQGQDSGRVLAQGVDIQELCARLGLTDARLQSGSSGGTSLSFEGYPRSRVTPIRLAS
jgi:hypothetical protein